MFVRGQGGCQQHLPMGDARPEGSQATPSVCESVAHLSCRCSGFLLVCSYDIVLSDLFVAVSFAAVA